MQEDFAIIVYPGNLQSDEVSSALEAELRDALCDLEIPASQLQVQIGSFGYDVEGATVIAVVAGDYFVGKTLSENISAWLTIGSRLKSTIEPLRKRFHTIALTQPAALALATHELNGRADLSGDVELLSATCVPVELSRPGCRDDYRCQPERYYVFVIRDAKNDTYVTCMRSNGYMTFVHRLPTGDWTEFSHSEG